MAIAVGTGRPLLRFPAIFVLATGLILAPGCGRPPRLPLTTDVTAETSNPFTMEDKLVAEGRRLYLNNCSICHGHQGMGDGPSRSTLVAEPANLTTDPVASYTDGQMFLAIRLGKMVGGRLTMPPVERMTDEQIWKSILFVRTLRSAPPRQVSPGR